MSGTVNGLPGTQDTITAGFRRAILQNPEYKMGGAIISGSKSYAINNGVDVRVIPAGTVMKKNSDGMYQPFIVAKTTVDSADNAVALTVGVAGSLAIQAAFGGDTGTLSVIVAGVATTVTVTAINTSTGVLTTDAITEPTVAGSVLLLSAVADLTPALELAITADEQGIWLSDQYGAIHNVSWGTPVIGGQVAYNRVDNWPAAAADVAYLRSLLQSCLPRLDLTQAW